MCVQVFQEVICKTEYDETTKNVNSCIKQLRRQEPTPTKLQYLVTVSFQNKLQCQSSGMPERGHGGQATILPSCKGGKGARVPF